MVNEFLFWNLLPEEIKPTVPLVQSFSSCSCDYFPFITHFFQSVISTLIDFLFALLHCLSFSFLRCVFHWLLQILIRLIPSVNLRIKAQEHTYSSPAGTFKGSVCFTTTGLSLALRNGVCAPLGHRSLPAHIKDRFILDNLYLLQSLCRQSQYSLCHSCDGWWHLTSDCDLYFCLNFSQIVRRGHKFCDNWL